MDIDFAIDEINREQDRWNLLETQLEAAEQRVAELEKELEEIRDLARTGLPPQSFGMTSLEEWEHYKINRIAGMANEALDKSK